MIEKMIYDYLNDQGIDCRLEVPAEFPTLPFAVIQKTGSSVENRIKTSTLAIQSYGESLYESARLNSLIIELMENAAALPAIARVHLNGDYNFTDKRTKRYRYQAVFDITHY